MVTKAGIEKTMTMLNLFKIARIRTWDTSCEFETGLEYREYCELFSMDLPSGQFEDDINDIRVKNTFNWFAQSNWQHNVSHVKLLFKMYI